ncbi:MAG: hypothetical protein NTW12_11625 [Deltaproteobacteria bacterium]|nr:hypothetical protein [Deltaproteobacteria bacterium]
MPFANQKGNVIAYVIIAMTTIAALAVGALYMSSSAALGELGANNLNRAYFLALAGKDYALIKNIEDTNGRIFTLQNQSGQILPSNDKFQLDITGNNITSTGIVNAGTPFEAKRKISITKTGFSSRPDISGFAAMTPRNQPGSSFVQVDATGTTASLGGGEYSKFGALVYGGSAVQGNCQNGKCDFGTGFRAFFVFQFGTGSSGDGFTFTFFNGDGVDGNNVKNGITSVGGDNGRGELLGYAGDSRVDSAGTSFLDGKGGRGIQPPKVAVEFDPYANFGSANVCVSGSRRDGTDNRNHIAYVFWGDNTISSCHSPATVGSNTYDDNRHNNGADTSTEPRNSRRPTDGADASYFDASSLWPTQTNWLLSNTPTNIYAFRVEVTRSNTQNSNNNFFYTINSWIKQCTISDCSDVITNYPDYDNTKIAYAPLPTDLPTLKRTIELNQTYHDYFTTFFFGWTAATGGATQNVILKQFKMNFKKEPSGCGGYGVWNNVGNAYFRINGIGCTSVFDTAFIGNIGPLGNIEGFTNAACTISSSPSSINYTQATTTDTNKNCVVYFSGTDK